MNTNKSPWLRGVREWDDLDHQLQKLEKGKPLSELFVTRF